MLGPDNIYQINRRIKITKEFYLVIISKLDLRNMITGGPRYLRFWHLVLTIRRLKNRK